MADTDFLSLIKQGPEAWNQWRVAHPNCTPDLNNAYLFESALDNFDLSGVNLERACLIGASLRRANLRGVNLQSAYANDADFTAADLSQATLSYGIFCDADFTQADLHQIDAVGTNFANACFQNTRTLDWNVDGTTILEDEKGEGRAIAAARKAEMERSLIMQATGDIKAGDTKPRSVRPNPIVLSISAASSRIATTLGQLFRPDDANRITIGSLNKARYGEKIEAVRAKAIAQISSQLRPRPKARSKRRQHLEGTAVQAASRQNSVAQNAKTLVQKHPLPLGLGAAALCAALLLNVPRSRSSQTSTVVSTSASVDSTVHAQPEAVRTTAAEVTTLPCSESAPPNISNQPVDHEYDSGAKFYGTFANGQPADGRGTMIYPTGNRYDGEFKGGKRQGCGTFSFAEGRRYIGEMRGDKLEGKGTWILENGERYIGEFKDNQCNGKGTFIFLNGAVKSGQWRNGRMEGSDLLCDRGTLDLPTSSDL